MSAANRSTAPCDDCGKRVPVPDTWPVDWAYCGCAALTKNQAAALAVLADPANRDGLSPVGVVNEMGRRFGIRSAPEGVSRTVGSLIERGLAERYRTPSGVHYWATRAGRKTAADLSATPHHTESGTR